MQRPSGVMSVSWSFFELVFFSLVNSEKKTCGGEREIHVVGKKQSGTGVILGVGHIVNG